MVAAIKGLEAFTKHIGQSKPTIIDFWATWCGPCKVISPKFEAMSSEFPGVQFLKVDVDEEPEIAQENNIRAMPTFIVYKDGAKVDQVVGADATKLRQAIEKVAASA
ncbi:uncharacterized protein L969DRAFT_24271 [Mixia osmundae IAM 14324]|uniref:uncharacterized protein n=1 Tax=Mixia osmundae (strain CBS 9802 / IAM 14324 / JCM 22182 / KY 12970) TaxID=764103 RepID=UPI0004A54782|nr:uncharacterized protein L969DRAFT_24271 [Mixia osmundae IAM 14324]KEI38683.1 hypothetical protein L969DRAFT_24271 [Mixia osmundae IAM 14324]